MDNRNIKYVFRGTTLGWVGNKVLQLLPRTCTTSDPSIAYHFAYECSQEREPAVIYIAKYENLKTFEVEVNILKFAEREVVFKLKPVDFYKYCDGYIMIKEMTQILNEIKIGPFDFTGGLSFRISQLDALGNKKVEEFYDKAKQFLKKQV